MRPTTAIAVSTRRPGGPVAESVPIDVAGWTCPLPLRDHPRVVLGHGGGGSLSAELVEHLFLPAFGAAARNATPTDAAVLPLGDGIRLAFTTDTFVVRPLFFPGGDIGQLAVNGTVNDLAMRGAQPFALSTAFILEEGLELDVLGRIATAMGVAAATAGVELVTGDTKVVESGHGDGLYVNTAGIGVVPDGVDVDPARAEPGDVVIVSGPIGRHGVAVLSVREGLDFGTDLRSDTTALHRLVATLLAGAGAADRVHVLRDPTRGGLAASVTEIAQTARVGIDLDEPSIPVPEAVEAACGFLGLDPMEVANEGVLVAIVAPGVADEVVAAMRTTEPGADATVIGTVTADHPGLVTARTGLGATRVIDRPLGEQLPRIC